MNRIRQLHQITIAVNGTKLELIGPDREILIGSLAIVGINMMPIMVVTLKAIGVFTLLLILIGQ